MKRLATALFTLIIVVGTAYAGMTEQELTEYKAKIEVMRTMLTEARIGGDHERAGRYAKDLKVMEDQYLKWLAESIRVPQNNQQANIQMDMGQQPTVSFGPIINNNPVIDNNPDAEARTKQIDLDGRYAKELQKTFDQVYAGELDLIARNPDAFKDKKFFTDDGEKCSISQSIIDPETNEPSEFYREALRGNDEIGLLRPGLRGVRDTTNENRVIQDPHLLLTTMEVIAATQEERDALIDKWTAVEKERVRTKQEQCAAYPGTEACAWANKHYKQQTAKQTKLAAEIAAASGQGIVATRNAQAVFEAARLAGPSTQNNAPQTNTQYFLNQMGKGKK